MLRPWELNIAIVRNSGTSIHVQIAQHIINNIQSGRFTAGNALPGSRGLAGKIKVNRKTVIQAYEELVAQGWLISENKRGTFISAKADSIRPSLTAKTANLTLASPLTESAKPVNRQAHDHIHFNEGLVDNRLIPFEIMARAMRHALILSTRHPQPHHSDPKGDPNLRLAITQMLNLERGLNASIDHTCMLSSKQIGVFVLAKSLIKTNDFVVFEQLSNPLARAAFNDCGANILNVAHDDEGIDMANLELLCVQYKIRAIYVTPQHQIPTTACMSTSRRQALLALAAQYHFLIIEDDAGHEYHFNNTATLPIASQPESKNIIYLGSISSLTGSAFNLGYMVANREVIDLCAQQINLIDKQGQQINQIAMTELLKNGEIKRHSARTLKIYQARRACMAELLKKELAEYVRFRLPESGLAIWLEVSPSINIATLLADAATEKVSFTPGNHYSSSKHQLSTIRLGYAHLNEAEMALGIQRLKTAFMCQQENTARLNSVKLVVNYSHTG